MAYNREHPCFCEGDAVEMEFRSNLPVKVVGSRRAAPDMQICYVLAASYVAKRLTRSQTVSSFLYRTTREALS
jgi:hypothetical protein